MSEIHDGIRARNECKGGYSKKAHAYKQAMREFQDSYYEDVGSKLGLTRLGPRVQRLTRKEWKAQQKQAQMFLQQHRELNKQQRQVTKNEAVLANEKQAIKQQESELTTISGASFFSNKRLCCLIQREDMPVPLCLILKRYIEFQAYLTL
jgi:hypothetical protein